MALASFALTATPAFAGPITVFGLNWEMQPLRPHIEAMGYDCQLNRFLASAFNAEVHDCRNGRREISLVVSQSTLVRSFVRFNCHVFNGCDFSAEEVSREILSQGIVTSFTYEQRRELNAFNGTVLVEEYCGRGTEGDMLCVISNPLPFVELTPSRTVSGGMSFD